MTLYVSGEFKPSYLLEEVRLKNCVTQNLYTLTYVAHTYISGLQYVNQGSAIRVRGVRTYT